MINGKQRLGRILAVATFLLMWWQCFAFVPPTLQCIQSINETTLYFRWSNSADCNQFENYKFYVNGQFCSELTNQDLCDLGGVHVPVTEAASYTGFIVAVDMNGGEWTSNSIQAINLTVSYFTDSAHAELTWIAPSTDLTGWGESYQIYKLREYDNQFVEIASVPNNTNSYVDTSDVCNANVAYKVGIVNNFQTGNESWTNCPYESSIASILLLDNTQPQTPVLDSVSYRENNQLAVGFHAPDSNMLGYIVYYENNGWEPIDTIYNTTYWIDNGGGERCYRLAVLDSCYNSSPMTNTDEQLCPLSLFVDNVDDCRKTAKIHWSTYANMPEGVEGYEVLLSTDDGANYQEIGTVGANVTSFTIPNINPNVQYRVYVRVFNVGRSITASSNRKNFTMGEVASEDMTYIRSVSVINNEYVRISVLTSGDTLEFQSLHLMRSTDGLHFEEFQSQPHQTASGYVFEDYNAEFEKRLYYYQTYVENTCGAAAGYSNVAHNILLTGESTAAQINLLQWGAYGDWNGDVDAYRVERKTESEEIFQELPVVLPPLTLNSYQDDVSQLFETGSKFTYCVKATENNNDYGFAEESVSNWVTLQQLPNTYIPNAFTPMQTTNQVFMPVNTFVSYDGYSFSIYSRSGNVIFCTHDPYQGWDGRVNGNLAPAGVYVYKLLYRYPNGETYTKTGSVTLIY